LLTVIIPIMKKILVLADLSDNTSHLTKAAVMLADKLRADILLFNNFQVIPVTSFYGAGPYVGRDETCWEQECRTKLDKLGVAVQQSIHRSLPGEKWQPRVFTQSEEGNFGANVNSIIALKDIELVIMGGSTESSFEHLLFGNKVRSVIDHASCPVLIIPFGSELNKVENVIFTTEFESSDIKAVHYLTDLGKQLHYQLNIVHINVMGHSESSEMERKQIFLSMLQDLDYAGLSHSEVRGKELMERLLRLSLDQRADLIALVHHHDSLIVRMIRQSVTGQILEKQTLPVIVFPPQ
jgi:nucleotide-binding universal stress UspA family protein